MQGFISSVGQTEASGGGTTIPETESEIYYFIANSGSKLTVDLRTGVSISKITGRIRKMNTSSYLTFSEFSDLLNKGFFQLGRLGGTDTNSYYCPFLSYWSISEGSSVYFTFRADLKNALFWKRIDMNGNYYGSNYGWAWNGNDNTSISASTGEKIIAEIGYIKNTFNFAQASKRYALQPFQITSYRDYRGCEVVGVYNERPVSFISVISPPKAASASVTNAIACWCNGCGWIDNGSFAKFERCYIDSNNVMHVSTQIYQPASDTYTSTWIALDSFTLYERY